MKSILRSWPFWVGAFERSCSWQQIRCRLFLGRRVELCYRRLQRPCATDEISQKLRTNVGTALVFGQVSLVMRSKEDLDVGLVRSHGVNERLENRNSIFRAVSQLAQGRERKPVCSAIARSNWLSGSRLSFWASVSRVRADLTMPSNSTRDAGSSLSFSDPEEIVELRFAHVFMSLSEPKMKIFGKPPTLLIKEPFRETLRRQSPDERKVGLILRRKRVSAFCSAAYSSE
jgi:hypothetical protein